MQADGSTVVTVKQAEESLSKKGLQNTAGSNIMSQLHPLTIRFLECFFFFKQENSYFRFVGSQKSFCLKSKIILLEISNLFD